MGKLTDVKKEKMDYILADFHNNNAVVVPAYVISLNMTQSASDTFPLMRRESILSTAQRTTSFPLLPPALLDFISFLFR